METKVKEMPNWLVPLDLARELKEIGVRLRTSDYYEEGRGEGRFMTNLDVDFGKLRENNFNAYRDYVAIPNYTQVIDWFQKNKLFGIVEYEGSGIYSYRVIIMNSPSVETDNKKYLTYFSAMIALVKKLIELYKNGNNI